MGNVIQKWTLTANEIEFSEIYSDILTQISSLENELKEYSEESTGQNVIIERDLSKKKDKIEILFQKLKRSYLEVEDEREENNTVIDEEVYMNEEKEHLHEISSKIEHLLFYYDDILRKKLRERNRMLKQYTLAGQVELDRRIKELQREAERHPENIREYQEEIRRLVTPIEGEKYPKNIREYLEETRRIATPTERKEYGRRYQNYDRREDKYGKIYDKIYGKDYNRDYDKKKYDKGYHDSKESKEYLEFKELEQSCSVSDLKEIHKTLDILLKENEEEILDILHPDKCVVSKKIYFENEKKLEEFISRALSKRNNVFQYGRSGYNTGRTEYEKSKKEYEYKRFLMAFFRCMKSEEDCIRVEEYSRI
jgi:hypothetical protein